MLLSILAASFFALAAVAQNVNCGSQYRNRKCDAGQCCSGAGWVEIPFLHATFWLQLGRAMFHAPSRLRDGVFDECDTTPAHCDAASCQQAFSGAGSTCKPKASGSKVPEIDVCGRAEGGVNCPGAGGNGYYYRCCSSAGHCGPKNPIQDQSIYCGTGCQAGYGKCDKQKPPRAPPAPHGTGKGGDTCGEIPNVKCGAGLCCSGSNFCGTGPDFCGAANWCQPKWGRCDSTVRAA